MPKIRAVIVDDEPLAREGIRSLLRDDSAIKITGECRDGIEAIHFLEQHTADLLFLDIQMPELNGFEVLEAITPPPMIIFVTAYDKYAVDAFNIHAFDYLLKPIDPDRFASAVERVKSEFQRDVRLRTDAKLSTLLAEMRTHERRPVRLMVRSAGKIHFFDIHEIDWIEAAGDYAYIHAGGKKYIHRETMKILEHRLSGATFSRIHRSTIVNTTKIKDIQILPHGEAFLLLHEGTKLNVSRTYRHQLLSLLS